MLGLGAGLVLLLPGTTALHLHADAAPMTSLPPAVALEASTTAPTSKEPITGTLLPTLLQVADRGYTLLGAGVRQVTFLYISAYTIGIYRDAEAAEQAPKAPELVAGNAAPASAKTLPSDTIRHLVAQGLVVRIQPTRNTDGSHLRNGFARLWQSRLDASVRAGELNPQQVQSIKEDLSTLQEAFPVGRVGSGEEILFVMPPLPARGAAGLELRCRGKHVRIDDAAGEGWVGRALIEAYVGPATVSPSTAASVARALCH